MAATQNHIPTLTAAVVELTLSNLRTFIIQGEITEITVSAAD